MTTLELESRTEQIIRDHKRVTYGEIVKEIKDIPVELRSMLRSIISILIIRNCWRIEYVNSRVFIMAESANNKDHKVTTVKHADGTEEMVKPKALPTNGDWVVTCVDGKCRSRLYFDKKHLGSVVRSAFAKTEKVDYHDVRCKMYRSVKAVKTMQNF